MAKNVFRLTPRATQALRAVEESIKKRIDSDVAGELEEEIDVVVNGCDFRFSEADGFTWVAFEKLEVMYALKGDREFFLHEAQLVGMVKMLRHTAPNRFTYYTVESVELQEIPEAA